MPAGNLYHVVSNVRVTFPKPGEALHQSYWQTVRRDQDGRMTAAAMGRSEDQLVKRDGKWLIQFRKLTVFVESGGRSVDVTEQDTFWTASSQERA